MKNIFKITLVLSLLISASSCTDSEALIDQVYDTVDNETGVVIRTIGGMSEFVTLTTATNNFIASTFEVQQGNGSFIPDFKEVRLYVKAYEDQDLLFPVLADDGTDVAEQLIGTLDASIFEISTNGLPRSDFEVPTQNIVDAYAAVGSSIENFAIPSFLALRLEIEMANGDVYTNTNVSVAVGGTYFSSPYLYRIIFLPL